MRHLVAASLLLVTLALPPAAAGTAEAPEVTDPAGDATCVHSAGNEWADIDAVWISGETETSFDVNMRLAKWTDERLATATGFTTQFTHQGTQFGVSAIYFPPPMGDGWEFDNGYIDLDSGELRDFSEATGSFTPGPPAVITVRFDKAHFPHVDANDTRLVAFQGGSADLKNQFPGAFLPVPPQPFDICDRIDGGPAFYAFQTGDHTAHMPSTGAAPGEPVADGAAAVDEAAAAPAATAAELGTQETPGPGAALGLVALVAVALQMRRRRG